MRLLVVGGGGREHALAWKLAQSRKVSTVYVAPGNAGTALEPGVENVPISAEDIPALLAFAREAAVSLTVIGPEAPLVAGICDRFREAQLPCFGPSEAAAQLEGSKAFTKDFLARWNIPSAKYGVFEDSASAIAYIRDQGAPIVVKADGLAAGKGVVLAATEQDAVDAVEDMLQGGRFGSAGRRVVIEELLAGEEASFICMVDGKNILPMATSQDHKARDEGDTGPNTGGMGAYSPAPVVTDALYERIIREVIEPTVTGMARDGHPYSGFLYAGLMIGDDGTPKVLEYNCRFGDPETQPIMLRLQSDLYDLCQAGVAGSLDAVDAQWDPRASVGVVMAAGGYPGVYEKGMPIAGLEESDPDTKVFHAGTAARDGRVVTAGGRVLCVCGLGDTVTGARQRAYERVAAIDWEGAYYRRDIGHRAVAREQGLL